MIKYRGIKTLEVLEGADNYNKWIINRISRYIKSPALEIGAGTGNISNSFLNLKSLVITDIDEGLVLDLQRKFKDKKNVSVKQLNIEKNNWKETSKFKSIYCVNVLEHIKDDKTALKNMFNLLQKNGKLVMLVPAKKFAYNKLDKNLGHYRRYEKKQLIKDIEESGFKVKSIEYFNLVGLLSWMIRDKISNNHSQLRPYQVKIFDSIVPILKKIEPKKNLPVGISLIVVAERK